MALSRLDICILGIALSGRRWRSALGRSRTRNASRRAFNQRSVAMKKRVVMAMIASMAFAVMAWGAEMEYSGTFCGIQKRNVLYSTSDLTVLSLESWVSRVRKHVRAVEERERPLRGLRPHYAREV